MVAGEGSAGEVGGAMTTRSWLDPTLSEKELPMLLSNARGE